MGKNLHLVGLLISLYQLNSNHYRPILYSRALGGLMSESDFNMAPSSKSTPNYLLIYIEKTMDKNLVAFFEGGFKLKSNSEIILALVGRTTRLAKVQCL